LIGRPQSVNRDDALHLHDARFRVDHHVGELHAADAVTAETEIGPSIW